MFCANPGKLPAADARELAGVPLPPGRMVIAQEGTGVPVAWISTDVLAAEHLDGLIQALAAAFPQTGLWPLRAEGLPAGTLGQPWARGEMDGPEVEIPGPLEVLTRFDSDEPPAGLDWDEPAVPAVTALAPATPGPDLPAQRLQSGEPGGLLLVPVGRPADVPAALGWWGGTNYDMTGADFSAVLRSWEDRFGAVLVSIGFATMSVQLGRQPVGREQVEALLREHYAFCPDNIDQGLPAETYRAGLTEWWFWNFWWD